MLALGSGTWGDPGFCSGLPAAVSMVPLQRWGRAFSGSAFQVWVIANKVQGSHSLSRGTVCRRTGVQPLEPKGQGWDYGIGVSRAGHGAAVLAWGSEPRGLSGGRPRAEPPKSPTV